MRTRLQGELFPWMVSVTRSLSQAPGIGASFATRERSLAHGQVLSVPAEDLQPALWQLQSLSKLVG